MTILIPILECLGNGLWMDISDFKIGELRRMFEAGGFGSVACFAHLWRAVARARTVFAAMLLAAGTAGAAHAQATAERSLRAPITAQTIAHERALMESLVAMATPGTRLCREITFGIGVGERVEAESLGVNFDARQVLVKITRVGQGPLMIAGREVRFGETAMDKPLDWVPCR